MRSSLQPAEQFLAHLLYFSGHLGCQILCLLNVCPLARTGIIFVQLKELELGPTWHPVVNQFPPVYPESGLLGHPMGKVPHHGSAWLPLSCFSPGYDRSDLWKAGWIDRPRPGSAPWASWYLSN